MNLGAFELLLIAGYFAIPFVVLYIVTRRTRRSRAYILWGFLGFMGLIVGLLLMAVMPRPGQLGR